MHLEGLASTIDSMLSQPGTRKAIKGLFGLAALEHDYDFVSTIEVSVQPGSDDARLLIWFTRWRSDPGKPRTGILRLEATSSTNSASG